MFSVNLRIPGPSQVITHLLSRSGNGVDPSLVQTGSAHSCNRHRCRESYRPRAGAERPAHRGFVKRAAWRQKTDRSFTLRFPRSHIHFFRRITVFLSECRHRFKPVEHPRFLRIAVRHHAYPHVNADSVVAADQCFFRLLAASLCLSHSAPSLAKNLSGRFPAINVDWFRAAWSTARQSG